MIALYNVFDNLSAIIKKAFVVFDISIPYKFENDFDEAELINHLLYLVFVFLVTEDTAEELNRCRLRE